MNTNASLLVHNDGFLDICLKNVILASMKNNLNERKRRMSEAIWSKDEWSSQEDVTELIACFDLDYEQPAKRQRVAEEQPETVVAEAVPVDPETDPVDSETVVAEPAPEKARLSG